MLDSTVFRPHRSCPVADKGFPGLRVRLRSHPLELAIGESCGSPDPPGPLGPRAFRDCSTLLDNPDATLPSVQGTDVLREKHSFEDKAFPGCNRLQGSWAWWR